MFIIFGACAIAIAPVLVSLAQMHRGFSALNIAISYFQVNATFRQFEFQWPKIVVDWFDWLAILNIDVAWLAPECLVDFEYGYLHKMAMLQLLPIAYAVLFAIYYLGYRVYLCGRLHRQEFWGRCPVGDVLRVRGRFAGLRRLPEPE